MSTEISKNWVESRLPLLTAWRAQFLAPSLAREKPYLATLPFIITAALIFMALSGFVLAVHYDPAHGYDSLQFIDRDVNSGWLVHAFHETGTTMIFGTVYLALAGGLFNAAYRAPGELVWFLGLGQFLLLLLAGYLGYALTDGAVSYWSLSGSTAAAGALAGLPGGVGTWFFGGLLGASTLARLAVFHAVLALAAIGIGFLYFSAKRAAEPAISRSRVAFHPYYTAQYAAALAVFALIFAVLVFFAPHLGENPLNLAAANPLITPVIVTPPWYLLAVSAFSHALPGSIGGIIAVAAALGVLFALPWLDRSAPASPPSGFYRLLIVILVLDVIGLCITAASPSTVSSILEALFTFWYFLHFLVLTPFVTAMGPK